MSFKRFFIEFFEVAPFGLSLGFFGLIGVAIAGVLLSFI